MESYEFWSRPDHYPYFSRHVVIGMDKSIVELLADLRGRGYQARLVSARACGLFAFFEDLESRALGVKKEIE